MPGNPLESWADNESIPKKPLESWIELVQVSKILLESWAHSNQFVWECTWFGYPQKVIRCQHLSGKPKKFTKSTVKSNAQKVVCWSTSTTSTKSQKVWVVIWFESKILEAFWVVRRFESKFRNPLSRELIWIMSCEAIVSHELIRVRTFWDWVESIKNQSNPCLEERSIYSRGFRKWSNMTRYLVF